MGLLALSLLPTTVIALAAWRARVNDALMPALAARQEAAPATVALVIPARNEAENLRLLLPTCLAQTRPPDELIVVDDDSTDATSAVAGQFGAEVLRITELPDGWTGKAHACHRGAMHARSEWLLFIDADVRLGPQGLVSAIAAVQTQDLAALSLLLRQRCETWPERLLIPFAYAHYFAGAPVREHFQPQRPQALMNGQFILIRRAAYLASGGFARVRHAVMEDLAFGRALKQDGLRISFAHGETLAQVRMYRSLGELWQGFAKTSIASLAYDPRGGSWTVLALCALGMIVPVLLAGIAEANLPAVLVTLAAYMLAAAHVQHWTESYGVPRVYALLHPLAASLLLLIALSALVRRWSGRGVRWKGRVVEAHT